MTDDGWNAERLLCHGKVRFLKHRRADWCGRLTLDKILEIR
jgi:hypothetical protein